MDTKYDQTELREIVVALLAQARTAVTLADRIQELLVRSEARRNASNLDDQMPVDILIEKARADFPEYSPNVFTILLTGLASIGIRTVGDLRLRMREKGHVCVEVDCTSAYWRRMSNVGNITLSAFGQIVEKYKL